MTGEITLRGRVLPIGGLKEKILAAHRSDIFTVIIPKDNQKDLKDLPKRVLKVMKIHAVEHMDEVLRVALALEHPEQVHAGPQRSPSTGAPARAPEGREPKEPQPAAEGGASPSPRPKSRRLP